MSDDLVTFLRARLDDDESRAQAAGNRRWLEQDNTISLWPEREDDGFMSWPTRADARHAARWDPARVLAEVEAKRQLVKLHGRATLHAGGGAQHFETATVCRSCESNYQFPELSWPCPTLRHLATPYATHPDYRPEWSLDARGDRPAD